MHAVAHPTPCCVWIYHISFIAVCLRYLCVFFVVVYHVHQNHRLPCVAPFPHTLTFLLQRQHMSLGPPCRIHTSPQISPTPILSLLLMSASATKTASFFALGGLHKKTRGWVAYHVSKKHLHVRSGFHIIFICFSFRHGGYCITGT